jgi:acetylornithine aminotransferase
MKQEKASLPNPDPPPDSPTFAMIDQHSPYMVATYARPPPMIVKGEGCYLWDVENRRFLDFTAGIAVNSLGHADAAIERVISQQVESGLKIGSVHFH